MKNFFYVIVAILIIAAASYFMFRNGSGKDAEPKTSQNTENTTTNKTDKIIETDIAMEGAVATLYYGDGCPHCTNIEKWLVENGYLPKSSSALKQSDIDSWVSSAKVKFNVKEVWYNKANSAELSKNAKDIGLEESSVGVPFLYDSANKKSYIGETEIKNFFNSK